MKFSIKVLIQNFSKVIMLVTPEMSGSLKHYKSTDTAYLNDYRNNNDYMDNNRYINI